MADKIYKLLSKADWEAAKAEGVYKGAPIDLNDGFMHFSTAAQAQKTLELYFAGQKGLVSLEIATADLERACKESGVDGARLQWDHSKSRGEDFPHLYGMPLPCGVVKKPTCQPIMYLL